jgi:hypothetical protein
MIDGMVIGQNLPVGLKAHQQLPASGAHNFLRGASWPAKKLSNFFVEFIIISDKGERISGLAGRPAEPLKSCHSSLERVERNYLYEDVLRCGCGFRSS